MIDFLNGFYTLSELEPEQRLDAIYEFLRALPDKTTRKEIYNQFPEMSHYQIDRVLKLLDFSDILTIWRGVVEKTDLAKRIEAKGKLELSDFSQAPSWVIKSLTRKPTRRETYVGEDTSTGYDIWYNFAKKVYVLRETSGKKIKEFDKLGLILTFSIATEGHEDLVCEMASWTFVQKMKPSKFKEIQTTLARFLSRVLKIYFGLGISETAIKGGLEYLSEQGTYISEATSSEFSVEEVNWDNAKAVVEYIHERKKVVSGVVKKEAIRRGKIEILLSDFEKKHPEAMKTRPKEIQSTLEMKLKKVEK